MIVFVLLGSLAMATMVNAPAIFLGYGLAYLVTLLAAWFFKPKKAFMAVLLTTIIALPVMVFTKAVFIEVALLNVIVRPPVAYLASAVKWRRGLVESALALTAIETLIALLIALLYYGDDGIHTSLAVFGIFLAPFGYAIYSFAEKSDWWGTFAGMVASLIFFFSLVTFPVLLLLAVAVASLAALLLRPAASKAVAALLVLALVVGCGVDVAFRENVKTSLYPFIPHNWKDDRWKQLDPACGNASNVFANTHTPERLRIVETCVEVDGRVVRPPFIAGDGDYCFDLVPDSNRYLGVGNYILRKGGLHVEVVPADHSMIERIGGVCPGDRVRVKGVWVIDTDHGMWTEIHPVVDIEILNSESKERWPDCVLGVEFG